MLQKIHAVRHLWKPTSTLGALQLWSLQVDAPGDCAMNSDLWSAAHCCEARTKSGQASCSNQCNIVNDMVMGASMGAIVKLPSISKRGALALSWKLCRMRIDERQRNAEHRLNLSNAELFTDSSAHQPWKLPTASQPRSLAQGHDGDGFRVRDWEEACQGQVSLLEGWRCYGTLWRHQRKQTEYEKENQRR